MDPVAFHLGPLEIRWYGIMMAASMLIGAWLSARMLNKKGYNGGLVWDALVWIIVGGIGGARIGYVLTSLSQFVDNPWEVFMIHHGGLSFHGGIIGGAIATYAYFRGKDIPFITIVDSFTPGVSFGIILVRIGNFMNGDILGYKWDGPWAMNFPHDIYHFGQPAGTIILRHPTELYGLTVGVFCFLMALLLWTETYDTRRFATGTPLFGFMLTYSVARSIIEDPFREVPLVIKMTDPAQAGYGLLTGSHLVSIPIIIFAIYALLMCRRWEKWRAEAAAKGPHEGLTRQQRRAMERDDKDRKVRN